MADDGQLAAMFEQMDLDNDGVLSLDDLSVALQQLGLDVDAQSLLSKLDSSGQGAVSFEDFRRGVLEQGIFGNFSGQDDPDDVFAGMSDTDEEEEDDNVDLLQEICENLRTDKAGRVSFTELERSISLCIGHLLADDDRDKMIKAFSEIEHKAGEGVPMDKISAVLTEWMSGGNADEEDDGGSGGNNEVTHRVVNLGSSARQRESGFGGFDSDEEYTERPRKMSLAAGTSFFTDDGDEQSQAFNEMEHETALLRKKLATAAQDAMRYKQRLQVMQQEYGDLERQEKGARQAQVRLQRKLKDTEAKLNQTLENETGLKSSVATLQQNLQRKSKEVATLSETMATWKTQHSGVTVSKGNGEPLTPKSSEIEGLRRQLARVEAKRKSLEQELAELRADLSHVKEEKMEVATKYEKVKVVISQLEKRHTAHEKEKQELKETISTLNFELEKRRRSSPTNEASFQVNEWITEQQQPDDSVAGIAQLGMSPIGNGDGRSRVDSDFDGEQSLAVDLTMMDGGDDADAIDGSDHESRKGDGGFKEAAAEMAKEMAELRKEMEEMKAKHEAEVEGYAKETKRLEVEMKMRARRSARAEEDAKRKFAAKLQEEAQERQREVEAAHEAELAALKEQMAAAVEEAKANMNANAKSAETPAESQQAEPTTAADPGNEEMEAKLRSELEASRQAAEAEAAAHAAAVVAHSKLTTKLEARIEELETEVVIATASAQAEDEDGEKATEAMLARLRAEHEAETQKLRQEKEIALEALKMQLEAEQAASDAANAAAAEAAAKAAVDEAVAASRTQAKDAGDSTGADAMADVPAPASIEHIFQEILVPWTDDLKVDETMEHDLPELPPPRQPPRRETKGATPRPAASAAAGKENKKEGTMEMDVKNALMRMAGAGFNTTDTPFNPKNTDSGALEAPGAPGQAISGSGKGKSRRRTNKSRRRSNLYSMTDSVMPENHKPWHEGGLQRFLQNKLAMAQRQKSMLEKRMANEGNTRTTGQMLNLEKATHIESFASQACAQVGSFKGDYRAILQNHQLQQKMKDKGMEQGEQIVFSTVLHRCVPAFLFFSTKKKRTLIISTKAIYECDNSISYTVRRRLAFRDLNCLSISTAAADVFALLPKSHYDLLYTTMRRTEIVARLMQCYEAEVGQPLKVRFMQSILLTMENGEIKTTYIDEENATVKMEEYKPNVASANQGFICPVCKQKFSTAPKLTKHFEAKHAAALRGSN